MANGIDAAMESDEATDLQAVADRVRIEAQLPQLLPRHDPVLRRRKLRDLLVARAGSGKLWAIIYHRVTHPADDPPRCPPFSALEAEPRIRGAQL